MSDELEVLPETNTQYTILLPKKKLHMFPEVFVRLLTNLDEVFGGYTIAGESSGSWLDREAGIHHPDNHLVILIADCNNPPSLHVLKNLLREAATGLKELSIFCSSGNFSIIVWAEQCVGPSGKTIN